MLGLQIPHKVNAFKRGNPQSRSRSVDQRVGQHTRSKSHTATTEKHERQRPIFWPASEQAALGSLDWQARDVCVACTSECIAALGYTTSPMESDGEKEAERGAGGHDVH